MTKRIIFRPTEQLQKKIDRLYATGKYKTQSDLIRNAIWYGIGIIEKMERK